jgi:hypothetical protein
MSEDVDWDNIIFDARAADIEMYEQQVFVFGDEVNWIVEGF